MDWASSQWKQDLSSVALQKVNSLEERIEKLQKERQQKQLQFECLELTFNKEKRKVEEEKQQTFQLERQLQSLADTCKALENKQQKLQCEIQNRDSRLNNLEGQLAQAKKQNSRLQQLENDLEDLRCIKENSKLENRELEEKLKKEKSTIVKQSDAISDLEQTIRTLQEKCSNTETSLLTTDTDKENINTLNISSNDSFSSESLRKKILEQENTISSLKKQLTQIAESKEKPIPSSDVFLTPAKVKNVHAETPISSAQKSFSVWDTFGSTPAKASKLTKHVNDSLTFDTESDEKVRILQQKLKQVCQELECQRHNSEAAKNAMEQRLKEKENALKSEVKLQAQTIFNLDKELKELQNKYQQDVVQANKKLDLANGQLQKSESSKQQMEKDLKAVELQISSRNSMLQQKEEELKDLLKQKNSFEASTKVLHSEKRELENNCSTLQTQKNALTEEIRDLKVHLDGSNNLVKEKESLIHNMKKEHDSSLKMNSDLQIKMNSMNKDLSVIQSEKNCLENQLQGLNTEISALKKNIENIIAEKKNVSNSLDFEKSRSAKLETDLAEKRKEITSFQSEIKSKEDAIVLLQSELDQLKDGYNANLKDLEEKLAKSEEENSHLTNKVQTYSDNTKIMEEAIAKIEKEKNEISKSLTSKISESETFRLEAENLESQLQSIQNDNDAKSENIGLLTKEVKSLKESYEKQLIVLNDAIVVIKSEKCTMETQLKEFALKEQSLNDAILNVETEKQNLSDVLNAEKKRTDVLDTELTELKKTLYNLQAELSIKNAKICEIDESVVAMRSEKEALENNLKNCASREESLQKNLLQIEADKQNLSELVTAEKKNSEALNSEVLELKKKMNDQQAELNMKDTSISELNKTVERQKAETCELNESVASLTCDKVSLENSLKDCAAREESLQKKLSQIETEKQKLSALLTEEKGKSELHQANVSRLEKEMDMLQSKLAIKDSTIEDLNKNSEELKIKTCEINESLASIKAENLCLQNNLKDCAVSEESMQKNLLQIEADKQKLMDLLAGEKKMSEEFQSNLVELKEKINSLQMDIKVKDTTISDLNKSIDELKVKSHEMDESIAAIKSEKDCLENNLRDYTVREESLQKNLLQTEADKQNLSDLLTTEKKKCEELHSNITGLKNETDNLQSELMIKDSTISDLTKNIHELKLKTCEINESLAIIKDENLCLQNNLKDCNVREEFMHKNLVQIEAEKQRLMDLLSEEKNMSEGFQSNLVELKEKISSLQVDVNMKDTAISDLNKSIDELKVKSHEMDESIAAIKSEKDCLENNLRDYAVREETLQKNLLQTEADKQNLSDLLTTERKKCEELQSNVTGLKSKTDNLQAELVIKDSTISDLTKNIQELKAKTVEISESFAAIQSEKASLENNLKDHVTRVGNLQKDLLQTETDKQNLLELLTTEKKKSESDSTDLKTEIDNLQEELKMKVIIINDLNKNNEELKVKLSELNEDIVGVKSEKLVAENRLHEMALMEELFQKNLLQLEEEKQRISEQLIVEKNKTEILELSLDEIKRKSENFQDELDSKETNIKTLSKELEDLKSYENLVKQLKNQLNEYSKKEMSLNEIIKQLEVEKLETSNLLTSEEGKNLILEGNIKELQAEVSSLKCDLKATNETFNSFSSDVTNCKESYELKLKEFRDTIETMRSDNENLANQMKDFVVRENTLKEAAEKAEAEKNRMSCALSSETKNIEIFEINIKEMKSSLLNMESEINCKDKIISNLEREMEAMKETYEEEKCNLNTYIQDVKSSLIPMQECIKDICIGNELIGSDIKDLRGEYQEFQSKKIHDQQSRKEFLFGVLDQISLIEKYVEALEMSYEKQISDYKMMLSDAELRIKSQNNEYNILMEEKSQLHVELSVVQEQINKKELELKTAIFIRDEHSHCMKNIEDLKTTHESLTHENYRLQEEKCNLNTYIQDVKFSLIPMQECIKDVYIENELIGSDVRDLRRDFQEFQSKKIHDQQSREEFLFGLLSQLNFIEKCVEDLKSSYEQQIWILGTELGETQLKVTVQIEEYNILKEEKLKILEELKIIQDELCRKEKELENAILIETKHLNCFETIENLSNAKENLEKENCHLQEQLSELKKVVSETESKDTMKTKEYEILGEERSKLLKDLKIVQERLCEKELELENAILIEKKHLNCMKVIENLTDDKENLSQENYKLKEQISDLKKGLSEFESRVATQMDEFKMVEQEKSNLFEDLKIIQEKLWKRELELENAILIEKEYLICMKNFENLTNDKESLNQEYFKLQEQISDLKKMLSEVESKGAIQKEEFKILQDEKSNLLGDLRTMQEKLCQKDLELEKAILIEKELLNCMKSIENLTTDKENLIQENYKLQEQISDFKKLLSEIESKAAIQTKEYDVLKEEKSELVEESRIIQDKLYEKELELENAILINSKHSNCFENIEVLTKEKYQLQMQISSISDDLKTAEEEFSLLGCKLRKVFLNCKNVFFSIERLQEQSKKVSQNLMNIKSDYLHNENNLMSKSKEMEDACDLILKSVQLFEEYLLNESKPLEIPLQVTEVENQYYQMNADEKNNSGILNCDVFTNNPNFQINVAKELYALSTEVFDELCTFEESVLCQKERLRFLVYHQLLDVTDLRKIPLKFMRKTYNEVCHKKLPLQTLRSSKFYLLFSDNQSSGEMVTIINLLSKDFKEDRDVHLFFEKCLLVNSYKNMYMASKLKKTLFSIKDQLNADLYKFAQNTRYFNKYQDIHSHYSHLPILIRSEYIIFMHSINSLCYKEKLNCETSSHRIFNEHVIFIQNIINNVNASKVPLILNCMFKLCESTLLSNHSHSIYKSLACFVMKMIELCYKKGVSFISCETINIFECFMHLFSREPISEFKVTVFGNQSKILGNLVLSLLQDLSCITDSVNVNEQKLQKNRNSLSEISKELSSLKVEYENKQGELSALQASLQEEKEKQQKLTMHGEEVEDKLSASFLQKEKWRKKVFEMSKFCSVLKNIFNDSCDILKLQSEIASLSVTFCLCQDCLTEEEESREKGLDHVLSTPVTLIHCIAELFTSKNDFEKEIVKLNVSKSNFEQEIIELERNKLILKQTIIDLEGNISMLEHEIGKFKSKYACLENEYQNISSLLLESNAIKEDQQNSLDKNSEEIRNCKNQYQELLSENKKFKNDLAEKEQEIENYVKIIQDKSCKYDALDLKCKNFEILIENSNATVTKLLSDLNETGKKVGHADQADISAITELKNKVISLERSKNMLNVTLENVEEELQNIYKEKQIMEEKLQESMNEVENLLKEIALWKTKVGDGENEISTLQSTVKELEKSAQNAEIKCSELLDKNSSLQRCVGQLESIKKNHEVTLLEKNFCIKQKDMIITHLKEEISQNSIEKESLDATLAEIKSKLNSELQDKVMVLHDLEKKLNVALNDKADLEKQMENLLISEEERLKSLQKKASSESKCKELVVENTQLKSKLVNLMQEKNNLEFNLQTLRAKVLIAEEEKDNAILSLKNFNSEREKSKKELITLKKEISIKEKSNFETSLLVQELQQKLTKLKKEISESESSKKTNNELSLQNAALIMEIDALKAQPTPECKCKVNSSISESHYLKSEKDYEENATKVINLLITIIRNLECDNDGDKADLISFLTKFKCNVKTPEYFTLEMQQKLQTFLRRQFTKQKELELKLSTLMKHICSFIREIGQYCESIETIQRESIDLTLLADKSCFENSICVFSGEALSNFDPNNLADELKNSLKMLELCFSSIKSSTCQKTSEIKSLRENLEIIKMKKEGPECSEMKSLQGTKQNFDAETWEKKCMFLLSNSRRLEKKYHELLKKNEQQENQIKILEQEKVELNAEADEMAEIIKQHSASDELTETCIMLSNVNKELRELKEENETLKSNIKHCQALLKQRCIKLPTISENKEEGN